jgi:hypothetical protein
MTGVTLAIAICAALALFALSMLPPRAALPIDGQDRSDPEQDKKRDEHSPRRIGKGMRIAWAGYGFAIAALVGHLAYPPADRLWAAMLVAAIVSVPLSAFTMFDERDD